MSYTETCLIETGESDNYHDCGCRLCVDLATDEHTRNMVDGDFCPGCGINIFPDYDPNQPWKGPRVKSQYGTMVCASCRTTLKSEDDLLESV